MTNSVWEIAANTPWWVYLLFIYLVRMGFLARKPRTVPVRMLFILPSILIVFSIFSLYHIVQLNAANLLIWLGAIFLGIGIGWLQYYSLRIKAVRNEEKLYVPGTWGLLIIVLVIFAIKFYFGYELTIDPSLFLQAKYSFWLLSVYGFFTGLFLGRLIYALRCIKSGPYLNPIEKKLA